MRGRLSPESLSAKKPPSGNWMTKWNGWKTLRDSLRYKGTFSGRQLSSWIPKSTFPTWVDCVERVNKVQWRKKAWSYVISERDNVLYCDSFVSTVVRGKSRDKSKSSGFSKRQTQFHFCLRGRVLDEISWLCFVVCSEHFFRTRPPFSCLCKPLCNILSREWRNAYTNKNPSQYNQMKKASNVPESRRTHFSFFRRRLSGS